MTSSALCTLNSPVSGVVLEVPVSIGQTVNKGELVALIESMKVHIRIEAKCTGTIIEIQAFEHDIIEAEMCIAVMEKVVIPDSPVEPEKTDSSATTKRKQSDKASLIEEWQKREALSLDENRESAVSTRHKKGYKTARENLASLVQLNEFLEYGQLAVAAQRQREDYETLKSRTAADGVITGIGKVGETPTALIINDYSVLAGTQGFFHHQKIDRMLEVAKQKSLPIVMFTEGGGGRPGDTDVLTVNSGLQCSSFGAWAGLKGVVPRIAVANGYNFAGNAALFGAADITIATRNSWIGMAGPAMIAGGGLGDFEPTDIGPSETQSKNGVIDIVVDDESHACDTVKKLVSLLCEKPNESWQNGNQETLRKSIPESRKETYSVRDIITTIADKDSYTELRKDYGASVITAFIQIEGKSVGVIANDCQVLGGAIDSDAGQKCADFMALCDQFELPIISFCDTPGFMVGPKNEETGAVRKLADMFSIGAKLTVPFYAVVLRKCYGLGAQAMLGGSTHRPIYTMSWPSGEFGPMGLEGAVKLGFKKELLAEPDDEARKRLFEQFLAQQYEKGKAIEVASVLELDAVIDPAKTRIKLSQLLASASNT